ncbi:magnesium-translocating P-type ATPase [Candidatus Protochlamydia phocaeensis]|uniref:magnesium-translocating P-type ATPase n=1 Tax=Candidatus Protochlamydia phocaeensis TaxID=1414722 RepID=UPI000AF914D2|nr:magnesium-translocating P-type ATPase [Candidatus Protochlamydia phocaeensis]
MGWIVSLQFDKEPAFWQQNLTVLLQYYKATSDGLTSSEVSERLVHYGPNLFHPQRKNALLFQFLSKFSNPLVIILLVASAISALTGDVASFIIISLIVFMSVTLDFIQEYKAGKDAEKLRQSVTVHVQVLRDGKSQEIPLPSLVPGDVVLLAAGDLVPGDGRILEAKDFFVNQALLTGEPYPVEKKPGELPNEAEILSASNTVLRGTSVVSGTARILVCNTGANTVLGDIADSLIAKAPPNAFEQGIRSFGLLIMRFTIFLVLFVLLVNAFFHRPWLESFIFAVALAVGLTPELLPMIVSVTLAKGAKRMAAKRVIVKQLASIQNLGSMDVLCTDKTGTLTEARIHLERHIDSLGRNSNRVLELAYLNSFFETGLKSPLDDAILEHKEIDMTGWRKIDEVPFDFERRRVSVLVDNGQKRMLVIKGAPEDILRLCTTYEGESDTDLRPLDDAAMAIVRALFDSLGREGFRVLGIAWRQEETDYPHIVVSDEAKLVFSGFAAFLDPPKESAKKALEHLAASGVSVKIVTGDNELVTEHICGQLGLSITGILTGADILKMDDQALVGQVESVNLFCRVTPAQKNRIILALKKRGHTVGYLGDGINDAPSLHSADIGISVDSAVDVAKDAAEMILLEHDLGVLQSGVIEGRRTFGNIMKYIMMGTSSNFGNMFSMAGGSLFLPFLPMLPTQILLNNMLYDISEIPIPMDNVDEEYLMRPRQWDINFIRKFMLIVGPISSIFDFLTFFVMLTVFQAGEALFHTGWFIESLATQVLVIFVIRTRKIPLKSRPNPWLTICSLLIVSLAILLPFTSLGKFLGFVAPPLLFFFILASMVIVYLLMVEVVKQWFYKHYSSR